MSYYKNILISLSTSIIEFQDENDFKYFTSVRMVFRSPSLEIVKIATLDGILRST